MRLALVLMGGAGWFGGLAHLRNLIRALKLAEPDAQAAVVAQPDPGARLRGRLGRLLGAEVLGAASAREVHDLLRRGGFDAVFSPDRDFLGISPPAPWLAFLHDFQHERLPGHFSKDELASRRQAFRRAASLSDFVLLSGESVLADAREFLPESVHKARIVPPRAWPAPDLPRENPDEVRARLGLPERFLLLPSQFWSHKNHPVALEALDLCRERGVFLAMTGCLDDERDPGFRRGLEERLAPLVRRGSARALGRIEYADVLGLMRRARAVVLPSLFEGFAIPVSEADALGKTVILSDIAPHREHRAKRALYFDPADASALAGCMLRVWDEPGPCHDPFREARGLARARGKALAAGRALAAAVREARAPRPSGTPVGPGGRELARCELFRDAAVALAGDQAAGRAAPDGADLLEACVARAGLAEATRAAYAQGEATAGDLLAGRLLAAGPEGDMEARYHAALEALRWGSPLAFGLLGSVADCGAASPGLRAWACFKLGQGLESREPDRARRLFRRALDLDPGHAKAALALVPPGGAIRLDLGPGKAPGFVGAPFDPLDDALWDYYLEGRQALALRLSAPGAADRRWPDDLAGELSARLRPGGSARVGSLDDDGRRLLAQALARRGFTVFRDGPDLVALARPAR